MKFLDITHENIDEAHICCAIGNDKENKARAQSKKDWMKSQFDQGLKFKRLDERGKVFIEYMPVETSWKPVVGENYYLIHCLWVSGQFKGKGYSTGLLGECLADARHAGKNGVAVVTSSQNKPFLTDKKFFLKQGFKVADTAEPYFELLTLDFAGDMHRPRFTDQARSGTCEDKDGFVFVYSNQCVFMEEYVALLCETAREMSLPARVCKLHSAVEAKKNGSPFGTLGIYYEGKFVTHELMTREKFQKLIGGLKEAGI